MLDRLFLKYFRLYFFSSILIIGVSGQARAQTQIDAVKMSVTLPAGYQVVSNPAEYKYQPSAQPAVFAARSGDLVFFVISHDIGGGSINDIGASYDAYYRKLLGQDPSSVYRYLDGHVLYQAAYAGPGKTIGYLLPEHKDAPIAVVNLWAISDGRGIGIYFQCPHQSYPKRKQDIEAAIKSFKFQGAADKREAILLKSPEFGSLVVDNPNDPNAPAAATAGDMPAVNPSAVQPTPESISEPEPEPAAAQPQPAPVEPAPAQPEPGPAQPDLAPQPAAACAVEPEAVDALAAAAKADCDLSLFLKLMQGATPEERKLIRNFLQAVRSGGN